MNKEAVHAALDLILRRDLAIITPIARIAGGRTASPKRNCNVLPRTGMRVNPSAKRHPPQRPNRAPADSTAIMIQNHAFSSPQEVKSALREQQYIASDEIATIMY
jgi:hypothetical protein